MSWTLKEIFYPVSKEIGYSDLEPGTCWRIPLSHRYGSQAYTFGEFWDGYLSPEFYTSGRDYVIQIKLPKSCGIFTADFKASSNSGGWTVTGELPNITVSPSINAEGCYHGWVQNGVLSDDIEGRTYNNDGGVLPSDPIPSY